VELVLGFLLVSKVESLDTLILDLGRQVAWEIPGDDEDLIDTSEEEDGTSHLVSSLLKATGVGQPSKKRSCPGTSKVRHGYLVRFILII